MKKKYNKNGWDYSEITPVIIDGVKHNIQMCEGMTGIGSRMYWIDGKKQLRNCVTQSADLTQGNHFIYKMNWRENPWDTVDIIIHEDELTFLLDEKQPKWRNPIKLTFIPILKNSNEIQNR